MYIVEALSTICPPVWCRPARLCVLPVAPPLLSAWIRGKNRFSVWSTTVAWTMT